MQRKELDLVSLLQERLDTFEVYYEGVPTTLTLSPYAFSWLIAIFDEDQRILGISPIDAETWTFHTDAFDLHIEIDELADDYDVRIS